MRFWLFAVLSSLISTLSHAQVVATVGETKISVGDFKKKYEEVKQQTINPPSPKLFLEDLVRFEIGVQEAEKQKLQNDPVVRERFRQELYKALVEKSLSKQVENIKINEDEMRAYYKNNPELKTSHILIEFKPGSTETEIATAKKRADEIYEEVRKSKRPFEELVKLYSDDTLSKNSGGDIGFQSRVTVVPSYYDSALKLSNGQITGPVRSRYGFHIIKLTGKRPYDEANKRQLRAAVFDQKRAKIFNAYFDRLKSSYKINVDANVLNSIK